MKSQDITENGYYWYFHDDGKEAVIICFRGGYFMFAGNEMPFQADEVQGGFIGPLRYPPHDPAEADAEIARLREKIDALESLRPHWAQGSSDDSIAAQTATAALAAIWRVLDVSNQTDAMVKLRKLAAVPQREKPRPGDNFGPHGT